jgi:hypothetical protein
MDARVTFRCECGAALEHREPASGSPANSSVECAACKRVHELHRGNITPDNGLVGCVVCSHPELYTRKSFPTWLGMTIVVAAAVLAPWTNYLSLVAAAALDGVLYLLVRDVVACYVCRAEHRGFGAQPRHPRFDREIAERLRFGARAVMGKPMRDGGTADAPEPEH